MRTSPEFATEKLTVVSWPDETVDGPVHDALAPYVENYWLGVLGPSATWMLRRVATQLAASPAGFVMDLAETAQCLGVGGTGKNSPFIRALGRLVQFEMARVLDDGSLAVRREVPTLSRRHLLRLPASVQARHEFWIKQQLALKA